MVRPAYAALLHERIHCFHILEAGALYSVGWNAYGQCGTGDCEPVRSPRRLDALSTAFPIRSVAAGEKHSLAVGSQGEVWGWGLNRYGQLGLEDDVPRLEAWESSELSKESDVHFKAEDFVHSTPQRLQSLTRDGVQAKSVFSGWNYSIVLTEMGQLFSFGWGMYGQLGQGDLTNEFLPRPIDFASETGDVDAGDYDDDDEDIVDCACGLWHAVAITESGKVYTWGYGKDGQMGHGTNKGSTVPQLVTALKDVRATQVCCGTRHTAILTDQGELYAWGFNAFGQVKSLEPSGEGEPVEGVNVLWPTKVPSLPSGRADRVWAGPWTTFALC